MANILVLICVNKLSKYKEIDYLPDVFGMVLGNEL